MNLSIIIPAFNEEKLLPATLLAIRSAATVFDEAGWNWELIVCDNNSTDRTAVIAREAGATVVFEPVNQIGRARNTGAAAAKGGWLIFVDGDSEPNAAVFRSTLAHMRNEKIMAGGCIIHFRSGGSLSRGGRV
jgi:glycosyltransferase involved in cell wall biosynthesis